jgi:biofilm PGA synthesis N-glycosyltransferase PgaC
MEPSPETNPPLAHAPGKGSRLSVLVPAYNESASIADTVGSLQRQHLPPEEIIVIDDCSTDDTAAVASALGVTVVRPPTNTGSKAGAQNYGLTFVKTEFVMAVDADTTLSPDATEKLMPALDDPAVAAACGFVLPRRVRSLWERGRYIEYMFAFTFYKIVQDYYEKPLISSGCFSVYRTQALRDHGGWSTRTMAEDMDLTWTFYQSGLGVRFVPAAVCYPIEPHNFHFMSKQLKRWSHGFVQNVRLHWRGLLDQAYLRMMVAVAIWDAVVASAIYLVLIPLLSAMVSPVFLLAYIIDIPTVAVPSLARGVQRGETLRTLLSLPAFFVLRTVNAVFLLRAAWLELIVRRPLKVYEKGH